MATIQIGTSGWNYDHWKGTFYPEDLNTTDWLNYYQERFNTVEVNNSFYRLPKPENLRSWKEMVKKGFIFSMKASRYITHMKKLSDPEETTEKMFSAFAELDRRLGPILFQLPPNWNFNADKLEKFLSSLPQDFRYVFELRDESWMNDETYELLRKYNAAFCIYDLTGSVTPEELTSDFVYVRLHGPDTENKYQGSYSDKQLSEWADRIKEWHHHDKDVFFYFNNDMNGYAPENAQTLQKIISNN